SWPNWASTGGFLDSARTGFRGSSRGDLRSVTLSTYRSVGLRGFLMFEGLLQPAHLLLILGIALLVFGPKKLPELGKGLGEAIRGLRSASNTETGERRAKELPASQAEPRAEK